MAGDTPEVPLLELESVIGFNGQVFSGLIAHPDREHLIYPLGCTVIIKSLKSNKQEFLHGHTNNVSCVTVSRTGKYVASGQVTFMGFKADIIVWDYSRKEMYTRLQLHKAKVEALAFSPSDLYLVSLGGQDDGSIVVWNIESREAICGSPASAHSAGHCLTVKFSNQSDYIFVSAGNGTLRVWELDLPNRKIRPTECQTGQLKRIVKCLEIPEDDSFFYCGTTTGDVLKINLKTKLLNYCAPLKEKFSKGVNTLKMLKTGDMLVGSGDGMLSLCKEANFKPMKKVQLEGGVTSITLRGQGHQFFAGAESSQIYRFNYADFKEELISTGHSHAVNDVAFPFGSSDLFATCSKNDIRVWHTETSKELLRITVPNMTCSAVEFMRDGRSIISAWNDGKIRVFTPESGKLMFAINNAHSMGVTALATTSDCKRIVSGGGEGQVRVWEIGQGFHRLAETMKEHKSTVSSIKIKKNDKECVTASSDGTCIIWDLVRVVRNQMVLANTLFRCVCYHPEEFQIITSGTDRKVMGIPSTTTGVQPHLDDAAAAIGIKCKPDTYAVRIESRQTIGYWEVFDGSAIRELEGSLSGSINGMDISSDGNHFVTGGDDKLVKVWGYTEGEVTHIGIGHSGNITRVKICSNSKYIITSSADGAVLRWKYPHPVSD